MVEEEVVEGVEDGVVGVHQEDFKLATHRTKGPFVSKSINRTKFLNVEFLFASAEK